MPDVSIVIVSFNGNEFLKNCLDSVFTSSGEFHIEVIVVDNNSIDGSTEMVRREFPQVQLLANDINYGYAKACNQGIGLTRSPYVLILNPDTIVSEDCLEKCVAFAGDRPNLGAMGVKMYDGSGQYLPESKRGFPHPLASFWKITGIYKLFPESSKFNYYYLGHLDRDKSHKIDVLTGAFMFVPKKTFEIVGLFDEDYFMYGEDIDLSYRIHSAGLDIFYYPGTSIIHFKGMSTKKSSFKYVIRFYRAMLQFSEKHFSGRTNRYARAVIRLAIYSRALTSLIKRGVQGIAFPLFDAMLFYGGMLGLKHFWARYYFHDPDYYAGSHIDLNLALYTVIWLGAIYWDSDSTKHAELPKFARAILYGFFLILVLYALFPTDWRSSRALIFLGFIWVLLSGIVLRAVTNLTRKIGNRDRGATIPSQIIIIGQPEEVERIKQEIENNRIPIKVSATLEYDKRGSVILMERVRNLITSLDNLVLDHILICMKDFPTSLLFQILTEIGRKIPVRIIGQKSLNIVGSSSKDGPGYMYSLEIQFAIQKNSNRLKKRIFDLIAVPVYLLASPIIALFVKLPGANLFQNLSEVLFSQKSFVGYVDSDERKAVLPRLKEGIFDPLDLQNASDPEPEYIHNINIDYALNYSVWKDLGIVMNKLFNQRS